MNDHSPTLRWRRSSKSGSHGGANCVEAATSDDGILVRDSKHTAAGSLTLTQDEWTGLIQVTFHSG